MKIKRILTILFLTIALLLSNISGALAAPPVVVDHVTSSLADGIYKDGQVVSIQVVFSNNVTVTGTPQLTLSTGTPATTAVNYISGSGTATLIFDYTIVSGNTSADLNYVATTSLTLNGGTIVGSDLRAADLTLPNPSGAGSLGANKNIVIDTTAPTINIGAPSVSITNDGPVTYTITYADTHFNTSTLATNDITLNSTGGAAGTVGVSGSGLTRTVSISSISGDGTLGISIAADTASDTAGNLAPAAGPSTTFTVDNTAPTVSITVPAASAYVNGAAKISFTDNEITAPQCSIDNSAWVACNSGSTTLSSLTGFVGLGQGAFTLYLKDTDAAGNVGTANRSLNKDTIAPTVAITAPATNAYVNGTDTISFTDSDPNAPQCSIDNSNWVACISGVTTLSSLSGFGGLGQGAFTLYLKDTDTVGNVGTDSRSLNIDTVAPTVAITAPGAGAHVNGTAKISFTDTETTAPQCSIDNSTWVACNSGVTTLSSLTGFGGLGQGAFTLYLKDTDAAGNVGHTSRSLNKDTIAPTVAITAPATNAYVNGTATISFTDSDPNSPQCSIDDSTWVVCSSGVTTLSGLSGFGGLGQGAFTLYLKDTDTAGNIGTDSRSLNKDTVAPTVAITAPAAGAYVNGTATISFTDSDPNAPQCSIDNSTWVACNSGVTTLSSLTGFGGLGQGTFTLYLKDTDAVGNVGTTSRSLIKDTVAPTVTITAPAEGAYVNGTTTISFTDSETTAPQCSIDNSTWVTCSSGVTTLSSLTGFGGLGQTAFTLYLRDTDTVGNVGIDSRSLNKDTIAPTVAITAPAAGAHVNGTDTISFTDSDPNAPQCSIDNSTWVVCSSGVTALSSLSGFGGLSQGAFTLYLKDTDAAGNVGTDSRSLNKDTVGPTVAITAPAAGAYVNGTATISFTDSDPNAPQCSIDNSTWVACSSGVTTLSSLTGFGGLGQGAFTLYLKDTDAAGNIGTTSRSLNKDTVGPAVAITAPAAGAHVNGTATISFTDSDPNAPQCSIDNSTWVTCSSGVTTLSSLTGFGGLGQGAFTLYLKDTDTAGNVGTTSRSLIKDTIAPTVTINKAVSQPDPTGVSPINFTVVFSEATTDFATGDVTLSGTANATTATVTGSGTTYNVAVTGMSGNGTVIATIGSGKAHDAAGNPNTASTSTDNTVTYDITPPTVTINQAVGQADPTNDSPINFTVVFNKVVTDFATGDVTLSGTANATTATVTGSGTTYNVAVTGMSGSGTVIANVPAGVAHDVAGNGNSAGTFVDHTVTYDITAPVFSSVTPMTNTSIKSITTSSAVSFTLSETLASGSITMTRTGGTTDNGSPHVCTLTGAALSAGAHNNLNLSNTTNACTAAQSLVNGSVYRFTFNGIDLVGNVAATVTNTGITFDTTPSSVNWVAPVTDEGIYNVFGQVIRLEVAANESLSKVVFKRYDYIQHVWIDIGTVYSSPYRVNFNSSILLPSFNEIDAFAYDDANNLSSSRIWLNRYWRIYSPLISR